MTNLSPDARDLLDKAHAALTPSAVTKMEVLEGIEKQIAAGPGAAGASSGLVAKLLLALTVAAGVGGGLWLLTRQPTETSTTQEVAFVSEPIETVVEPTPQVVPQPMPAVEEEEHIVIDDVPIVTKTKRKPKSNASNLVEERKLISAAQRSIREGAHAQALRLLSQHKSKFPSGILAPERQAARAIALCLDGQSQKGSTAAAKFVKRHPKSPLAARVRRSCDAAND